MLQAQHCSLHLVQEFDRATSTVRARPIMSKKSAPWLILATGNLGNKIHVDETAGIYISTDAGWSWRHVSMMGSYMSTDAGRSLRHVSMKGSYMSTDVCRS